MLNEAGTPPASPTTKRAKTADPALLRDAVLEALSALLPNSATSVPTTTSALAAASLASALSALHDGVPDGPARLALVASFNDAVARTLIPRAIQGPVAMDLVWDLDDVLIKSARIQEGPGMAGGLVLDAARNTTVEEDARTTTPAAVVHVDDDQMIFRTVLRSFTHLILAMLQPVCRHHVFTSASRGYMKNVVSLVEHVLGPNTFQPKRLSCTDFPRHHLIHGKDISNLDVPTFSKGCILVDDNARYHQTQPVHGIQIGVFSSIDEDCDDALFEVACNVLRAAAAAASGGGGGGGGVAGAPLTKVCIAANKDKYWEDLVLARAFALSRDHVCSGGLVDEVDAVLANDAWGSAAVGDVLHVPALERVGVARRKRFIKGFHHWTKYFNGTKL